MTPERHIDEWALNAYLDGELKGEMGAEVEAWLAEHPADAATLAAWKRQSEALKAAFAGVLDEEVPAPIRAQLNGRSRSDVDWQRISRLAAAVLIAGAIGAAGWFAGSYIAGRDRQAASLADEAFRAHRVYSAEMRHAVEVVAAEREHLLSWLSKRVGSELTAPDLTAKGLNLVGGRLLPFGDYSMAQFMYEDANKRRITLYMANNPSGRDSAFLIDEKGGITTCYWLSGPLAYAIAGSMGRDELMSVAQVVYDALEK